MHARIGVNHEDHSERALSRATERCHRKTADGAAVLGDVYVARGQAHARRRRKHECPVGKGHAARRRDAQRLGHGRRRGNRQHHRRSKDPADQRVKRAQPGESPSHEIRLAASTCASCSPGWRIVGTATPRRSNLSRNDGLKPVWTSDPTTRRWRSGVTPSTRKVNRS